MVGEGEEGLRNENVCNGNLTFNGWTNDNKFESKKEVIESNNNFFLIFVNYFQFDVSSKCQNI